MTHRPLHARRALLERAGPRRVALALALLALALIAVLIVVGPNRLARPPPPPPPSPQRRLGFWVLTTGRRPEQLARLLRKLRAQIAALPPSAAGAALDVTVVNDAATWRDAASAMDVARAHSAAIEAPALPVPALDAALQPPSVHLAHVFRWTLDRALVGRGDDAAVVLEDDLDLAWDAVAYFAASLRVLERDASLFCVSAWNDNGFLTTSGDDMAVLRGEHFMGLGWMMARHVYVAHVRKHWPPDAFFERNPRFPAFAQEWDDYFRRVFAHELEGHAIAWECAYPEVPRTHHTLAKGTNAAYTTSLAVQRTRFDSMRLHAMPPPASAATAGERVAQLAASFGSVELREYDRQLERAVLDPSTVVLAAIEDAARYRHRTLVFVCGACLRARHHFSMHERDDGWNDLLQHRLGLLARGADGIVRGVHRGAVVLSLLTNRVIILAGDTDLAARVLQRPPAAEHAGSAQTETLLTAPAGQSCDEACRGRALACDERLLPLVNSCVSLAAAGLCASEPCERHEGTAWPARDGSGRCGIGWTRSLSCAAAVVGWQRLCVCA